MLDRLPTPFDAKIYSADWHAWRDPDVPEWIDPIGVLLDRHIGTPREAKTAIVADGRLVSYGSLARTIRQYSAALASIGLQPESRLLLFGTDSLDYVTTWLAAIRLGATPVVVSDLYKQRELLYFLVDTAVRALFIDGEQLPKLIEIASELPSSLKTILVRGAVAPDIAAHFRIRRSSTCARLLPRARRQASRASGMSMTSPTCSIPAAPPARPRASPIWPMTSCWYPSGTAISGNIRPTTSCSRRRRSISPTACGQDC